MFVSEQQHQIVSKLRGCSYTTEWRDWEVNRFQLPVKPFQGSSCRIKVQPGPRWNNFTPSLCSSEQPVVEALLCMCYDPQIKVIRNKTLEICFKNEEEEKECMFVQFSLQKTSLNVCLSFSLFIEKQCRLPQSKSSVAGATS